MFSLLLLSMVLSAPSAATQTAVVPGDPPVAESTVVNAEDSRIVVEPQSMPFDAIEVHPGDDICYKIRAYIYSTGPAPKLLRETTCGPKRPAARNVEGAKPKLVPIDAGAPRVLPPER